LNRLLTAGIVYAVALLFFHSAWVEPAGSRFASVLAVVVPVAILVAMRTDFAASAWSLVYSPAVLAAVLLSMWELPAATILLALAGAGASVVVWSARQDRGYNTRPAWLLGGAVLLGCFVAFYSSPQGAPGDLALRIAHFLHISPAAGEAILIGARKTVHFLFYGLMGLLAWKAALQARASLQKSWLFGLFFVLAHALFDEGRQSMYASRTGSGWDVGLDILGAVCFIAFASRRSVRVLES
jgi:VanZ family protein